MNSNFPKVSILILTMNHEKLIAQACRSAMEQDYPNLEIIFLDNISTDASLEIAKQTLSEGKIPYQVFKNEECFGVAKNLNFLLSKASGEYIAILSGDDWWATTMVSEKVKFLQNNPCDFALSDGYKFLQESEKLCDAYSGKDKEKVMAMLGNFFHENVTENRTVNVGTFVKKSILDQFPFDEDIQTEDWDMNLRLTHLGYTLGFVDKKLFYYRVLETSLSRKWEVMEDSYKKVTHKYLDYINSNSDLKMKYQLHLLQFRYEIMLSKTEDRNLMEKYRKDWLKEKYKIKYTQPILFFKLLLSNFK